jgi:hypothetical protein
VLGVKPGIVMDPMLRDVQKIRSAAESPAPQPQPVAGGSVPETPVPAAAPAEPAAAPAEPAAAQAEPVAAAGR